MNIADPISSWLRALPEFYRGEDERFSRLDLIGIDMAPSRAAKKTRTLVPVITAVVIGALLLVGLRTDVRAMRYAGAEALTLETDLLDQKRSITVQLLRLREPKNLSEQAGSLGFAKPVRVITLVSSSQVPPDIVTPSVAAEPQP